ncbi:MAG: hypothetical protein L6R30_26530 [Thermoanaerobaculia bacterium]|nr:hypothetical protein [Thermoanaerobaculia bacterium]MCK6685968.1 hypothetical protein [Thermoanaerobaculia bacterium]
MAERQPRKARPSKTRENDRTALLVLLLAGVEKYRELFHREPPSEFVRLAAETREALGLFY